MKKNLFCIWLMFLAILFSVNMEAQMTIGGKKEPEAFSVLELLNKGGLRLPQMTTAERNAFAVQGNTKGEGLTIYNIDTKCVEYWNKVRWVSLCEGTSQTVISPQACLDVAADGTGCDSTFDITDPDCPNGPFNITITAGSEYATLSDVDIVNGKFNINFFPNETVNIHTVLVRVTSTCTSLYKEFLFSQKGVDCNSMTYPAPTITASGTTLCTGGSVYLSVPANSANLDKLIWTRNGIEVARGVNYYIATQKGKYNVSMGAAGCNTNAANEKNITESGTVAPSNITILASNNGVLCGTNSVILSASGTTGSIMWFHNGVQETNGATATLSGDSSVGDWFAAVKDGNCFSKQSNTINITKSTATGQISIPDSDILVNGKPLNTFTSFCSGGSLYLSVANKQSGISYAWYNGNDLITVNPFVVPSSQNTMSLRMIATDNSGAKCPAEAHVLEKNITTGNTPGQPNITGKTILCDGSTDLTIVPAAAGTYTYTWYKDNVKMSETAATITVSEGGVYNATVANATGCTSTMAVKTVSSTVSSLPVVSWISNPATATFGAKVTLQASGTFNPTSYAWTADNGASVTGSGASVSIQLPASGTDGQKVKITVTAKNDCGDSVPLTHEITLNNLCPTPVLTAQSGTTQNITAGTAVTLSVSASSAVQATYQWYSNTSTSTTGGTAINGATTASYSYTPSAVGTTYFYCIVKNGCSGNPTATSPAFTINATVNPINIPVGTGTLGGRTCFDIAESNFNTTCGTQAARTTNKADFNTTAVNTQTYTFTPVGTVSKVRFVYVESITGIVKSFIPDVDNSQTLNVSGFLTAKMIYNTNLSSSSVGANNGMTFGKTAPDALKVIIYAIYNTKADGSGADATVKLTAQIKDCACCGANIDTGVWKEFMCHNLGVDQSLDPFTPDPALNGSYYNFGAATPTDPYDYNPNAWATTNGVKTAKDPCPAGYRIPTGAEWYGVITYNTKTLKGVSGTGKGGILLGETLMIPYASYQFSPIPPSGRLSYFSSTSNGSTLTGLYNTGFSTTTLQVTQLGNTMKTPIRCISIN
ncbi:hypothetical protein IRZ71_17165 [Flavobacterium sp. ANB]|uniref:hypothetical protein n=1 Tax=unclassified Flavobacterium TaxID=196869 RepID=UPI0012B881C7|nr:MULTISPECIES: hypothetical protein [unclassified Flavobacterium]MBF4518098.1 hypothetical protein [Flavobacterium sp. ANB]MTD71158.1 hypothetical protein [Flavobacterium sp. LC2016-13]